METRSAIPSRTLLGLTAAVLSVHCWLLTRGPQQVQAREPLRAPAFATRSVPVPPAPAAPSEPPAGPTVARAMAAPRPPVVRVAAPPAAPRGDHGPPPGRFAVPASMQLQFHVTAQTRGQPWQGRAELHWRHDGDSYQARLETGLGSQPPRVQHSAGRITAQGLAPERFSEKARTEQATHFERQGQRVTFSNNRPPAPLLAGAQDRLSVLLQLAAMLAGQPERYPQGTSISVQTASTREAETWVFAVGPEELLELPGGAISALKLDRSPRHEFDARLELWLAPGRDYVPVRLRLTQPNGDWVDQQWSSTDRR